MIACKYCVATKGLRGDNLASLFKTDAELFEHIESAHHMPVRREGENEEDTIKRFLAKHPEAKDCVDCKMRGAPWTETP